MRKLELLPTDDNIIATLNENILGRNTELGYFLELLNHVEDAYSIAIDGKWGSGKTFFVKQAKLALDACNDSISMDDEKRTSIKETLSNVTKVDDLQPQYPVYYDAWEHDNDIDPILSLIYSITEAYDYFDTLSIDSKKMLMDVGQKIIDRILPGSGAVLPALSELFKTSNILNEQKNKATLQEDIQTFLHSLIYENGNRLVVIIDELDRCRPDFAVKLLERIKHYFVDEKITFVFSINLEELSNTVRHFYGEAFNAGRYLGRFFDLIIKLNPANLDNYYKKFGLGDHYYYDYAIRTVISSFHFELRDIIRFISASQLLKDTINKIPNMMLLDMNQRDALTFCGFFVVPIMLGINVIQPELYGKFIRGEEAPLFVNVIKNMTQYDRVVDFLLGDKETFLRTETSKTFIDIEKRADSLYNALFSSENSDEIIIGKLIINQGVRDKLLEISSLLSNFSDFKK
ncbi:P-loop NTPase fold protein [Megasphaera hexanoica]|uniref:P-loop NTPase fold protein n=1 Tax=Megasphaera hexanoica TaxID=1675036 RepID=A0ABW7DJX9_9FIRM|nr:P-loop NTPase fold protein [Megasphaera hexanoica]AXB82365.1 hypothetical protein ACT01_09015 [Megasphaera hexanoica]